MESRVIFHYDNVQQLRPLIIQNLGVGVLIHTITPLHFESVGLDLPLGKQRFPGRARRRGWPCSLRLSDYLLVVIETHFAASGER